MRIAYVAVHLERALMQGGVGRKITTQIQLWQQAGHQSRLFLLTPDELSLENASVFRFDAPQTVAPLRLLFREGARSRALSALIASVQEYRPDVIYFRYGLFAWPLPRLFRVAPVVVEINSNDVDEYRSRGLFFYSVNRLTRGQILRRAAGLAPASYELATLPANLAFQKPVKVISNGIDLSRLPPLEAPQNVHPRLAFVGSPGYGWHGVDKLLPLARQFPDLEIEVIGYRPQDLGAELPPNLHLHGFMQPAQVQALFKGVDVAIGTLALHRKNMQEASPLKVREALGLGLPVILAYWDTDLSEAGFDFVLQLPNQEDNVVACAEDIRRFAYRMQGRRADRARLVPLIDQNQKEAERLAFMAQFAAIRES